MSFDYAVLAFTCDLQRCASCILDFERYTISNGYNASQIDQTGDGDDVIRSKYSDYCRFLADCFSFVI